MLAKMQIAVLDMARGGGAYTHETIEGDVAFHRCALVGGRFINACGKAVAFTVGFGAERRQKPQP